MVTGEFACPVLAWLISFLAGVCGLGTVFFTGFLLTVFLAGAATCTLVCPNLTMSAQEFMAFIDAREMPLLLCITFTALFARLGVLREVLFMLFLLRGILGVTVIVDTGSIPASSTTGDGVLMRDTENRPCIVGVLTCELKGVFVGVTTVAFSLGVRLDLLLAVGVSNLFLEGDLPVAGDELLEFGDFFPGD